MIVDPGRCIDITYENRARCRNKEDVLKHPATARYLEYYLSNFEGFYVGNFKAKIAQLLTGTIRISRMGWGGGDSYHYDPSAIHRIEALKDHALSVLDSNRIYEIIQNHGVQIADCVTEIVEDTFEQLLPLHEPMLDGHLERFNLPDYGFRKNDREKWDTYCANFNPMMREQETKFVELIGMGYPTRIVHDIGSF